MNRLFVALLVLCITPVSGALAQDAVTEVQDVIDRLFDGMRAGDGDAVATVLDADARIVSTGFREGEPYARVTPASGFIQAVGAPHDFVWNEIVWDLDILVRDNLASAWMDFAFFAGERFSHCGVNAMQLARSSDGVWRIVALADTRTPAEECDVPPEEIDLSAVRALLRSTFEGRIAWVDVAGDVAMARIEDPASGEARYVELVRTDEGWALR